MTRMSIVSVRVQWLLTVTATLLLSGIVGEARADDVVDPNADPVPQWIWGPEESRSVETRYFRVAFDAGVKGLSSGDTFSAALWAACDNEMTVYLNGKPVVKSAEWGNAQLIGVQTLIKPGLNVLGFECHNSEGPAGLIAKLEVKHLDGSKPFTLVSNASWKTSGEKAGGWLKPKFNESKWSDSREIGAYGIEPWGKVKPAQLATATPASDIVVPPGFKAELIYSVPRTSQGSWVSMTPDPKGRLYVSDQQGPLYRVTPGTKDQPTVVETVDLPIGLAQGMLWAFDSLYVVVNGGREPNTSGLYRLKDTDGDDVLDEVTQLKRFLNRTKDGPAGSEHGPHAVRLGPDNKLYIVAGNFTSLPEGAVPMSPAKNWSEDLLLKRMTDGKGHDPTIYAPAGWICRTDEEGKTWEVVATGMRNTYDFDFNADGEMLGFDSDMEWDIGMPWWRPIRITHVVPGAEFGWRNGSAKWPEYYPDSVPPVLNLGVGSPTGVTMGYGAKFPAKYQRAMFAADWAYGKIYAVHLTPKGSSYEATSEHFLVGKPFDTTDVVINHDGAMYITIGGRGTQSGLYRITYEGDESTAPVPAEPEDPDAVQARKLRHELEAYQVKRDPKAIDFAWPLLSSDDRFLRFAARVALEAQDPGLWTERALAEENPTACINALVGLCRVGNKSLQQRVLDSLARFDFNTLTLEQKLEYLRAYELCFIRMGMPMIDSVASSVATKLRPYYPSDNTDINHELCQLLVYLKDPAVISPSLDLLANASSQQEKLFYIFTLRTLEDGWKPAQRKEYFEALGNAQQTFSGGASFTLFLENVRRDAIETLDSDEKTALGPLLKTPVQLGFSDTAATQPARSFVRNWTMDDLKPKLHEVNSGRSFENGKLAFAALSCTKCHRFNGGGGASGPDISGVGNRFQLVDLLEAIVEPSKIISDQYQATEIITQRKQVYVGSVVEENDEQIVLRPSPLSTYTETVKKAQIAERRPSKTSMMPQGLLDVLREDEVFDLLAYLRAGGDPKDPAFTKTTATAPTASAQSEK